MTKVTLYYHLNFSFRFEAKVLKVVYLANRKRSLLSVHRSASKSVWWCAYFCSFFFGNVYFYCQPVIRGYYTKFPIYKVWWLREASQIGQTFILLYVNKSFKHTHGRIPTDRAILASIGHRFIATTKIINKQMKRSKENTECVQRENKSHLKWNHWPEWLQAIREMLFFTSSPWTTLWNNPTLSHVGFFCA